MAPTPVTPPVTPTPSLATITGHVTATNGGQALGGLTTLLAGHASLTDGAGTFSVQTTPASSAALLLSGSGIVPRSLNLAALTSHDVAIGAIALGGNFDLTFYRELVRNGFEGGNEPLRRWTVAPSLYIRTVREDGVPVDPAMVETVAATLAGGVPVWTAGRFQAAAIERGSDTRQGQAGWLTVNWPSAVGADRVCGTSAVGGTLISLYVPTAAACGCNSSTAIRPRVVLHELGHALGFWHTDSPTDVMIASSSLCELQPSARELAHAAIAYARPVGNLDPDQDPIGVVTLAAKAVR